MLKSILISIALFVSSTMILAAQAVPQQQACPDGSEYRDGMCIHSTGMWLREGGWILLLMIIGVVVFAFLGKKIFRGLGGKSDPTSGKSW
jgi:hypothetical protein